MHGAYVGAIETRLGWLRWSRSPSAVSMEEKINKQDQRVTALAPKTDGYSMTTMSSARWLLAHGDTFYMDQRFCHLVDAARESAPSDLAYEPQWLISPNGWMWLGEPVRVPDLMLEDARLTPGYTVVRAVGWRHVPLGTGVIRADHTHTVAAEGTTHFMFFIAFEDYRMVLRGETPPSVSEAAARGGFGVWSYFTLEPGDQLDDRIVRFEHGMRAKDPDGAYIEEADRVGHRLHEIRWLYAALKLMSQRLTSRVRVPTARHVRRRAEREGQEAPPYVEVVTLRRLHHQAIRSGAARTAEPIDWQWQWVVRGHWRNQWYPAEGIHKPKFIESFLKGPDDRPLKPMGATLFAARR